MKMHGKWVVLALSAVWAGGVASCTATEPRSAAAEAVPYPGHWAPQRVAHAGDCSDIAGRFASRGEAVGPLASGFAPPTLATAIFYGAQPATTANANASAVRYDPHTAQLALDALDGTSADTSSTVVAAACREGWLLRRDRRDGGGRDLRTRVDTETRAALAEDGSLIVYLDLRVSTGKPWWPVATTVKSVRQWYRFLPAREALG